MIISIISFIFVFTAVTLAHEFGHLLFSRRAGIRVLEFGLGFGPRLISFVRDRTLYTLNLVPILGFVRIAGLDEEAGRPEESYTPDESYQTKTPGQKFASIFGGPLFNMILAFLIFYVMFTFTGVPKGISNEIAAVAPASEAMRIGIMPGDKIIFLGAQNKSITKIPDIVEYIHKNAGKKVYLVIERKGERIRKSVTPQLNKKLKIGLVGFSLKPFYVRTNPFIALYESFAQLVTTSLFILYTLGMLLIGKISVLDLAGPVGIAYYTGQVASEGVIPLLSFTAFLSINLGLLNLLPLPALDGGRLVFIAIEKIRGRAVDASLENKIHQVGLILLLVLMAVVTANDILRIFRR
jgi:regulator of sigma E protease